MGSGALTFILMDVTLLEAKLSIKLFELFPDFVSLPE